MAFSSDEIIKREIIEKVGYKFKNIKLRIFPEASNDDQLLFSNGGLTFGYGNVVYGSCDACWYIDDKWLDGYNNIEVDCKPIIVLEGTDALNRRSSGNAQYQRFHHVLGAVKNGCLGIYYLKKGKCKIQPDLFGMAYNATKKEKGIYLIIDDLQIVKDILCLYNNSEKFIVYINNYLIKMKKIFETNFSKKYKNDWKIFAEKRSTIIKNNYIIKYAARMRRNFTDGSQRAGHIALGEMYLTKYYFFDKYFYYLFLKMTSDDLINLDKRKTTDKEWYLLRNEPGVKILTIDDIENLDKNIKNDLLSIKDEPVKGKALKIYQNAKKYIHTGLENNTLKIMKLNIHQRH